MQEDAESHTQTSPGKAGNGGSSSAFFFFLALGANYVVQILKLI